LPGVGVGVGLGLAAGEVAGGDEAWGVAAGVALSFFGVVGDAVIGTGDVTDVEVSAPGRPWVGLAGSGVPSFTSTFTSVPAGTSTS